MMKGSKHSKEAIAKITMNNGMRGVKFTEERRVRASETAKKYGVGKWMKGRRHSPERLRKMSDSMFARAEHSYNWKGGVSRDKAYVSWLKNKRNRIPKTGSHSFNEWEDLKVKSLRTCRGCKRVEPDIKLTQDHIIPLSKGGSDDISNIQPLCKSCNSKKHSKLLSFID